MKKLIAAILLLFYTANTFGYLILFYQLRTEIQKEMFSKIENFEVSNCIEKILIKNSDRANKYFHRLNETEFEYLGKKYDIVREIVNFDETIFYCVNDKNEEILEKAFAAVLEDDLNNDPKKSQSLTHLKNKAKENLTYKYQINSPQLIIDRIHLSIKSFCSFHADIITPPPKLYFS